MENSKIISIEGLKKHFNMSGGKFTALNSIDLQITKGEFTGVVGPSGSGKTTLLNLLTGRLSPDGGSVDAGVHTSFGPARLQCRATAQRFAVRALLPQI